MVINDTVTGDLHKQETRVSPIFVDKKSKSMLISQNLETALLDRADKLSEKTKHAQILLFILK